MRKYFCIGLCAVVGLLSGCTHLSYNNTYGRTAVESANENTRVKLNKVAIFPFADYSYQQDSVKPLLWGLNRIFLEDLTDEFVKRGILVAVQEDSEGLLISEGIIKPVDSQSLSETFSAIKEKLKKEIYPEDTEANSPAQELKRSEHSSEMSAEIRRIVREENKKKAEKASADELVLARMFNLLSFYPQDPLIQGVTVSLSKAKVVELGRKLGVDAVIRGRIIEAGTVEKTTYPSLSTQGIVPFLFSPFKQILLGQGERSYSVGYAQKERYETDLLDAYSINSSPTGKKMAVLQVRVYIQDAQTGDVIWSGRSEAVYNPNVFKRYEKGMFDKVSKQICASLAKDLFLPEKKSGHNKAGGNQGYIYLKSK